MDNQVNQHIEMPQIQFTDKVADESVAVQRQVSPRTTETKAPRSGGDADKDVHGEAITKCCWSEGKKIVSTCKQRLFKLTATVCTQQIFKLNDLAHEISGVNVAQKTRHKLLDERQHATESSHIASTKEIVEDDTAKTANSQVQESIKGLNDKHSKFEIEQENVTDTLQCVISTIDHGEQVDHINTGKGKSKHTGKGKGKQVDVVETEQPQPSETASTMLAIVGGDADESMDMVRPEAEAWRPIHSRYAQNTLTAEMISGSLFHDHADEHNQLPDEFVISMESKEQKQTEDLAGMQAHHHELHILLPRSLDEYQTKFRDDHNEITKTMKDLSIIQHQAEFEEKTCNEHQLRKELSMVAQGNDAETW